MNQKHKHILWICTAIAMLFGILAVCLFCIDTTPSAAQLTALKQTERLCDNLTLQGVPVGGMTAAEARTALENAGVTNADQVLFTLTIDPYDEQWIITARDINATFDVEQALDQAFLADRTGSPMNRQHMHNAILTNGQNILLPIAYDAALLQATVETIAREASIAPAAPDVTIDPETKDLIVNGTGREGRTVDAEQLFADVTAQLQAYELGSIKITSSIQTPALTQALADNMQKINSYTSPCIGSDDRLYNIRKACAALNGQVVQPGDSLDLRALLGECTEQAGWKLAEGADGIATFGGGVTQVSSTLYCAALQSGMTVTQRQPTVSPVDYMPVALEASLEGSDNLCFTNPTQAPVVILTSEQDGECSITFYGASQEIGRIMQVESQVISTWNPPSAKVTVDATQPIGYRNTVVAPQMGQTAEAYRKYYDADGNLIESELLHTDTYAAVRGEYIVGQ